MPISLSQVLSVILALAVVYYVLGLIVSALTKVILEALNTRGKSLEAFLNKNLLGLAESGQQSLLEKLKQMPQLDSLKPVRYAKKYGLPVGFFNGKTEIIDYVENIPPRNLVDALFDLAGTFNTAQEKANAILNQLPDKLPGSKGPVDFVAKQKLQEFVGGRFNDIEQLHSKMETWFSGLMDQASQVFKAQARVWVVLLSVLVTFLLGVDSIDLAQKYWQNAAISATANAQASLIVGSAADENQKNADTQKLISQLEEMKAIDYNWYKKPSDAPGNWLFLKILGILITTFAVSQGSSFWYDLIKRLKGDQATETTGGSGVTGGAVTTSGAGTNGGAGPVAVG
jgi:hypothetical protein